MHVAFCKYVPQCLNILVKKFNWWCEIDYIANKYFLLLPGLWIDLDKRDPTWLDSDISYMDQKWSVKDVFVRKIGLHPKFWGLPTYWVLYLFMIREFWAPPASTLWQRSKTYATGVSPGRVNYWRNALNRKRLFGVPKSWSIRYRVIFFTGTHLKILSASR